MDGKTLICRICIDEIDITDKYYNVFEKNSEQLCTEILYDADLLIFNKIMAIAKVNIEENDGLPCSICSSCFLELQDAYNFKKKCEKADDILRIAANKHKPLSQDLIIFKEEDDVEFNNDYSDDESYPLSQFTQSEDVKINSGDVLHIEEVKIENETIQSNDELDTDANNVEPTMTEDQDRPRRAIDLKVECHDCGNIFKSKCKLRVHWKKTHNDYRCPLCKRVFKSCKAFLNHKKRPSKSCLNASKMNIEGEGKSKVLHCKQCDYSTKSNHSMVNHLVVHSTELPYSCDLCPRAFARPSTLREHKERAHEKYLGQRPCPVCGIIILGKSRYWEHLKKHNKKKVSCKICNKTMTPNSMLNHMKRHTGVKAYACEICAATFFTGGELYVHKKNRHAKREFYSCTVCGYKVRNPYCLAKHEKRHTSNNCACTICGQFKDNETQLALHKQRHLEKHLQCEHCEKKFFSRKNLLNHLRNDHKIFISTELSKDNDKNVKMLKNPANNITYDL